MGKTIADLELEVNAQFEYWLLATPRSLRDRIPGFEPVATRTDTAAELAEIQVMVDTLHSAKEIATRPMDGVAAAVPRHLRQLHAGAEERWVRQRQPDAHQRGADRLP